MASSDPTAPGKPLCSSCLQGFCFLPADAFSGKGRGWKRRTAQSRRLPFLRCEALLDRRVETLSLGQKKKASLLCGLLTLLLFCRLLASTLLHFLVYGVLLAAAALLTGSSPADGGFLFFSLLLFLPCLAGMYGMGLIAGAVSLRAKKTGSLIFLIQTALLFVTNTLTPTAPGPLFLIPFCSGIDIARRLYLYGYASAGAWAGYLLINLAWCLLGNAVFGLCMRRERRTGAWDTY